MKKIPYKIGYFLNDRGRIKTYGGDGELKRLSKKPTPPNQNKLKYTTKEENVCTKA